MNNTKSVTIQPVNKSDNFLPGFGDKGIKINEKSPNLLIPAMKAVLGGDG